MPGAPTIGGAHTAARGCGAWLAQPLARPNALLSILDISEYYSDRSGGVRTYLDAKGRYVASRPELRRTLVIPGPRDGMLDAPGNRTYRLRGPAIPFHSYRFLLATRTVARIIAHEQPDVVEIGSAYFVPWVVSRARKQHPTLVAWFYHSNIPRLLAPQLSRDGFAGSAVAASLGMYVNRLARLADVTFAASDFVANELQGWGVTDVERVTLGVDLDRFHPRRRAEREAVRERLGVTSGPLIGFVGRMAAEKQVETLLRAWPTIEKLTGATLLLVGDGPQSARIRANVGGRRVLMLPHQTDREVVADLMAALDVYVSPAPFETFGLAVCEALASGVPVVSVDHGGAAELVKASGAGALPPLGDTEALAEAVLTVLGQERSVLSGRARRYTEQHHSWETALAGVFAAYHRLRR